MPIRFTDAKVAALAPPADGKKDKLVFDEKLQCLAVRVGTNGRKTFLFQARQKDGRQIRESLGRFPALTVGRARDLAKAKAGRIASGADLRAERAERKAKLAKRQVEAAFTVSNLIDLWTKAPKKNGASKREGYAQAAERRLRRVLKQLLSKPAVSITIDDLTRACEEVAKPAARHATTLNVKTIFRWAKRKRLIAHDPAGDLELPETPTSRDHYLEGEEAQAVWKAAGSLAAPYSVFIRFLLATCVRRSEAALARWSEFNDDLTLWSIPSTRMKSSRPHLVPIPAAVRDLVVSLPRFSWSDRVFTADGRRSVGGFSTLKRKLDQALSARGARLQPWRWHDFRRSAVTWMAGEKIRVEVSDKLLAHGISTVSTVGAVYQRFEFLDERREALERWAAFLSASTEG